MRSMKKVIASVLKRANRQIDTWGSIPMNVRQMRNFLYVADMFTGIPAGDVVECGVGKARTLLYFGFLIEREGAQRNLWGFDSFEGFPEPTVEDTSSRNPKKGEWAYLTPDDVRTIFRTAGVHVQPKLVKGFFVNTVDTYDGKGIALLHLDVDLYQSYLDCFPLIEKVVPGGVVMFDEYKTDAFPGATKAIDELCRKKGYTLEKHPWMDKYCIRV